MLLLYTVVLSCTFYSMLHIYVEHLIISVDILILLYTVSHCFHFNSEKISNFNAYRRVYRVNPSYLGHLKMKIPPQIFHSPHVRSARVVILDC